MSGDGVLKVILRLVPIACFASGALFLALCFGFWKHEQNFLQTASIADGVVLGLDTHTDSNGSPMYAPVFTFTGTDAEPHTVTSKTSSNPAGYAVGQHVQVIYGPANPAGAEINSFWQQWLATLVWGVFAAAFLVAAIFFWILAWFINKRSKPKPLTT